MRYLKLTVAYDGTDYVGWQVQPNGPTVQQVLERTVAKVTQSETRVVASGRTDSGVHARGQVVSLATDNSLPVETLLAAINANLPLDVRVHDVCEAPNGFHAIRDATGKRYRYDIYDGPVADVFTRRYSWFQPRRLDEAAMRRASAALVGTHDFSSFEAAGSPRAGSVRTVFDLSVQRDPGEPNRLCIEVDADGFLYNMVRNIVGTLVEVGQGRRDEDSLARVLTSRDRKAAGPTAPAHGLTLLRVSYDRRTPSDE